MRVARAADFRRRAYERAYSNRVVSLRFENVPSIGGGEIHLSSGPSFICGGNGAGKSSVLHGIHLCLTGDAVALPAGSTKRLEGGSFACTYEASGVSGVADIVVENGDVRYLSDPPDLEVSYLDAGPRCYQWLADLATMANVDELLDSLEPSESSDDELLELRYLTGKAYQSRLVYEIEEFAQVLPYHVVRAYGAEYGFEDMGLGELALNVLYWHITHVPRKSVVLLEEPETFVSARSQRAWMDLLCKYSVERELDVIVTTHSFGIVGGFANASVTMVHGGTPSIGVVRAPLAHQLNRVLGVKQERSAVLLFEDEAGRAFGNALVDRFDPELGHIVDAQIAGGSARVRLALEHFPRNTVAAVVGVYDADVEIGEELHWPQIKLPGARAPEAELRSLLPNAAAGVATLISRQETQLITAHAALEGEDDHDWLVELSRMLRTDNGRLIDALVGAWIQDEQNEVAARQFVDSIRQALSAR